MKLLYIIGYGMGLGSITDEGAAAISEAQVVMGPSRVIERLSLPCQERFAAYRKEEVDTYIASSDKTVFALLVTGDTGFYSAAADYSDNSLYWVRCIAGISSVSYFFAKCRLPWQDAKLLSAHDKPCQAVDAVRRNRLTFLLTGGNVSDAARELCEAGFSDLLVHVGESLGALDETVGIYPLNELCSRRCSPLTVLLIENPYFDSRQRTGIPADEFLSIGSMSVSSGASRAALLSSLCPAANSVCWDIGSVAGAVSVEMALAAYEGRVFALVKDDECAELVHENSLAFQIGCIEASVLRRAQELSALPAPDCVYVEAGSVDLEVAVSAALSKNRSARFATTAASPQTAVAAIEILEGAGLEAEIFQLACARGRKQDGLHRMVADDPVYIISGGGRSI